MSKMPAKEESYWLKVYKVRDWKIENHRFNAHSHITNNFLFDKINFQ